MRNVPLPTRYGAPLLLLLLLACPSAAQSTAAQAPPAPVFAQPGKDVVWVPSPLETIEMMLDLARVTADDYVIDLGSGDGRTVIAAAKRGARALGVEYNDDLVVLSRQEALRAGVGDRARFVQGDMYEADVSQATVLALFLLTENLRKLTPSFLTMRPGSRIVSNTFTIPGWTAAATIRRDDDCVAWCTVTLYVVPARVSGTWTTPDGTLELQQQYQEVAGTYVSGTDRLPVADATVAGDVLSFTVGTTRYEGRVAATRIDGTVTRDGAGPLPWQATRLP